MIMHTLGSPFMVPLTAMVPYCFHLPTVVSSAVGALLVLGGGLGSPGICPALCNKQCNALGIVNSFWRAQRPVWSLLQHAMGHTSTLATTPQLGCVVVLWSAHLLASLLITGVLYYMELRSRLQWLLLHSDSSSHSAALALWHSGGVSLAWTYSAMASLLLAGLVAVLVLGT